MKTKLNLLAAGIILAAVNAGFGQATVQFSAATSTVAESAGTATLSVRRLNDTSTLGSVDFATADGTATNGLKYTATNGTLAFGPGTTNQTLLVPILNNGLVDGTKNFKVILSNPTNAILGTPTTNTVSITDNDTGLQFVSDAISVAEDAGVVKIGVVRCDDGTLPVTVGFATTDVTAINGLDYTGTNDTLSFGPTERLKLVSIPILNDSLKETATKTFRVTLSNPVGATLGSQKTTTVAIVDNDQGFQFELASSSVAEDAGMAFINVLRGTDDTNSTATVDYATTNLTAISGVDYLGTTNMLVFAPGEKVKLVSVPILNDGVKESTKNFRLTLSNPTGGAVLGSRTTTSVSILDNDPGVGFELSRYTNAWENAGGFTVTVLRGNDDGLGPITVDYATSDLTAKVGQDYQAVSGPLQFNDNETIKTLTIPILPDGVVENTESFRVTLSNATGGAALGTATTTVDILDGTGLGSYVALAPPFDPLLTIRRDGEVNILTWTGGGQLQRADRVEGPWQTLIAALSPCAVQSRVPATFYKVNPPRPATLYVPSGYDRQSPMPLVILLHMLSQTGAGEESDIMKFRPLAEQRGFLYCYPDGTINQLGYPFWNATDACCDFWNTGVDDAGYLQGVIEEIARRFAVDRKRIYLVGHLNGGFLAYRLACQSADLIASIASINGATFLEPSPYEPSEPVNILHIHTTDDPVVPYEGGIVNIAGVPKMPPYPGAEKSVQIWAGYNGSSDPVRDASPSLDSTSDVPGLDTVVTRYTTCPPGGAVELWTINGGGHVPKLSAGFSPRVIDWLLAHPKP